MKIEACDRHDQETIEYFEKSDGRRYRFASSNCHVSAIYEQIWIGFVAWRSVRLALINNNVEIHNLTIYG
jgi:hypothetical protein